MPLSPGTRLGRYEIVAPLGAGGMGEVYRAHDSALKRDVAIKIVPDEFAADADRLRRFEQEALATAALNHPNILAVHDVGAHGNGAYVVSELLEGRTLREVLASGALPLRKAVDYAGQIAGGLAAAHEKGIVHRDLKPANLFVTVDDRVKILDFGIARVLPDSPVAGGAEAATAAMLTQAGSVVGTAGYMAPEQVRGESVDHRADIFSLGAVFYEMVTRRRAFQRDSVPGTLAAILDDDPPAWTGDGSALSARVIRLIGRCLEKSPRARFQSARDLSLVLSDEITDPSAPVTIARRRSGRSAMVLSVAMLALGAGGMWLWSRLTASAAAVAPTVIFPLTLPAGDRWGVGNQTNAARPFAISADGRQIAYAAARDGVSRLYVRALDAIEAREFPGTEGANQPFFSPDGSHVGFFADGRLSTIAINSGVVRAICAAETGRGGTWGEDGVIVFAPTATSPLMRVVAAAGATPEPVTRLDAAKGEISHRFPQLVPGGRGIVFVVNTSRNELKVAAQRFGAADHAIVVNDGSNPHVAEGRLVYADGTGELFSAPFDPVNLAQSGPVVARHERPNWFGIFGAMGFSVSANGTLIFTPFQAERRKLAVISRGGAVRPIDVPERWYEGVTVAPDGHQIAFHIVDGMNTGDVWRLDLQRPTLTQVTRDHRSRRAVWSPDGKELAYGSARNGVRNVFIQPIGGGDARQVTFSAVQADPTSWAIDGWIVATETDPATNNDVMRARPGQTTTEPLQRGPSSETWGRVSPDGRWLSFTSNQSGRAEVYLTTYPTPGAVIPVSQGPGNQARWAPSGSELFFARQNGIFSVKIAPGGEPGTPQFAGGLPGAVDFDVLPDGSFVVIKSETASPIAPPLVVVTGWLTSAVASKK